MTDKFWSKKLTWEFDSGELKTVYENEVQKTTWYPIKQVLSYQYLNIHLGIGYIHQIYLLSGTGNYNGIIYRTGVIVLHLFFSLILYL